MKQKMLVLFMSLGLTLSLSMAFIAANADNSFSLDLANGVVLSNTVTSIKETGENLVASQNSAAMLECNIDITTASVQNETIQLVGTANGLPFDILGNFCSISENGNIVVFNSTDNTNSFRVVYCAIEKELDKSALYFESFAKSNPEYNVVTKLYLAPGSNVKGQYIMMELYGNGFPAISAKSIAALPEDHRLNLFWYAKEFQPISTNEEIIETEAANSLYTFLEGYVHQNLNAPYKYNFTLLETYTYQNLGMTYKHNLQYIEQCGIHNVKCNQVSDASATLTVIQKWVDAELENESSSDTSMLDLRDISIGYFTMPGTAVLEMTSKGQVACYGALKADYSFKAGANMKGLSVPITEYFSWTTGSRIYQAGEYDLHTNSGGKYCRDAVVEVNPGNLLNAVGNYVQVDWGYGSHSDQESSGSASLVFKFIVDNRLNYAQSKHIEHVRSFKVNVKK